MSSKEDYFGIYQQCLQNKLAKPTEGYRGIESAVYRRKIFPGEIEFYKQQAKSPNKPILELGCGNGLLLISLAKEGFTITGVEISKDMIDVCEKKIERLAEEIRGRITLIKGDMCNVSLSDKYHLIILGGKTIQFAVTKKQKIGVLMAGSRYLESDGCFVIDTVNPWALSEPSGPSCELVDMGDNTKVIRIWEYKFDHVSGEGLLNILSIPFKKSIVQCPEVGTYRDRISTIQEMELLAERAGLEIAEIFSDFNRQPLSHDSQNVIYVLKKSDYNNL